VLGRVHVQPNDVGELLLEPDVIGDFESLAQMGLEAVAAPNARDCGRTGTGFFGHGARASAALATANRKLSFIR
jgi:hypothetical protein